MISNEERQRQNKWIRALHEPLANVHTDKSCITFNDIHKTGEYKLMLVDFKEEPYRLILFQGLTPLTESPLSDCPAGIATLHCDPNVNTAPCLAVASGSSVLVYRNMKPYYRFTVPQLYLHPPEIELWERVFNDREYPVRQLYEGLKNCAKEVSFNSLTEHSQQFLAYRQEESRQTYIDSIRKEDEPPILSNVRLSCISTMKRNQQRPEALDVMVIGAEMGGLYWVDCQAFTLLEHLLLKNAPDKILNIGLYDIEFRTFVITRGGEVVILKKTGRASPTQTVFYLRNHPIDMTYCLNQLIFSTRDNRIMFYSIRGGKCLNELKMDGKIKDIAQFFYEPRQYQGILVAVDNEVRLYIEMFLVDTIKMDEEIDWIQFGRMGFEEGVLLIGTVNGGLSAKIFRRTAVLGERSQVLGAPAAQNKRLNVPRRTKAFIDQSLRERDNYQRLHQVYQRDLFLLKYNTVKTFANLLSGETGLQLSHNAEPINFNLDLLGFGPTFLLIMNLTADKQLPLAKRSIVFTYDQSEYTTTHKLLFLPDLIPSGVPIKMSTHVKCLRPENQSLGEIRIVLIRSDWKQPVFSISVQMPVSEQEVE